MNEFSGGQKGRRNASAGKTEPDTQIGSQLKALYQAFENEPVPQHFVDLLRRLDEAERERSRD